MLAQEIALNNLRSHGAWNDRRMSLTNPSPNAGYGKILLAIRDLPREKRTTQINVMRILDNYDYAPGSSFSTHDAWRTLVNAKLIEKTNGAWTITELGEKFIAEELS